MKVLYVAGFQGPELIRKRHIVRNRSLAGTAKTRAIAAALAKCGHDVTIYSVGVAAECSAKIYRAFEEKITVPGRIVPVYYSCCLDLPVMNRYTSTFSLLINLHKLCKRQTFDVAIVVNCDIDSLAAAWYCRFVRGIPVVLEYEDSVVMRRVGRASLARRARRVNELVMRRLTSGVLACTPELADAIGHTDRVVLPGALSEELVDAAQRRPGYTSFGQTLKVFYCGNLDRSKGVDLLMDAVELVEYPLEIHICGKGPLETEIQSRCAKSRHRAYFEGVVSTEKLYALMTSADIAVNPHRTAWHKGTLWPFKVIEYLAACGVVVSARTGRITKDLEEHLHLYKSDEPAILAGQIEKVINNWGNERTCAPHRMRWAIEKWGPERTGRTIEQLLMNAGAGLSK